MRDAIGGDREAIYARKDIALVFDQSKERSALSAVRFNAGGELGRRSGRRERSAINRIWAREFTKDGIVVARVAGERFGFLTSAA